MNAHTNDLTKSTAGPRTKHKLPPRRSSTGGIASPITSISEHEKIEEIRIKYRRRVSDGDSRTRMPRRRSSASSSSSAASQQKALPKKANIIHKSGSLSSFEVIGALGTALQSDDGEPVVGYTSSEARDMSSVKQQSRRNSATSRSSDHRSYQSSQSSDTGYSHPRGESQYDMGATCDTSVTPSEVTTKRRNSAKTSRRRNSLQKYAEKATMQIVDLDRSMQPVQADKAGGGIVNDVSASNDPRDQDIRDLKNAAESSQTSIQTLTDEMRLLNQQIVQDSKLKDEASKEEIASLKAELRASYKKNISISKLSKTEITRLKFEIEKRDEEILRLQQELEALKLQRNIE